MLKKLFYVSILAMMTLGCAEVETASSNRVVCDCSQTILALVAGGEDFDMAEEKTNAVCSNQTNALIGIWNGLGSYEGKRFVMDGDGNFQMLEMGRKNWILMDEGTYWVELEESNGVVNTILHMDSDNLEDYVVQYHFENGVLHLEEPTDFEPTMRFERAAD